MKSRHIALIAAGIAIYIILALIHVVNRPQPIDHYAIIAEYNEQQVYEQKDLAEPEQLPVNEAVGEVDKQILPVLQEENQQELVPAQNIPAYHAENAEAAKHKDQLEEENDVIKKQEIEALQLDPVALQETVDRQHNYIQTLESQVAEQINTIQQFTEKNKTISQDYKQLSQELQQRTTVIKHLLELNKQLKDELKVEVLKKGKLIAENNNLRKKLDEAYNTLQK